MPAKLQLLIVAILLLIIKTSATSNVTYASPPPITSDVLFNFEDSPADHRLILSPKL